MGRVRCPQVSPDVTSARWEAETCIELVPGWRKGAGTSVHWPIPLLHWSTSPASCLPFLSFKQVSPIPPSFKTSCSVLVSLSVSFVPSVLARARRCHMTLSPIRKEKMDTKLRHICCFGRHQYGLTPSFGCCDGKCKCVTGVHNIVWERRGEEGFILQWFLPGCKWCWSPWVFCITVGKQTSQVSSQTVHEKTIKQLNRWSTTKGQEFSSH